MPGLIVSVQTQDLEIKIDLVSIQSIDSTNATQQKRPSKGKRVKDYIEAYEEILKLNTIELQKIVAIIKIETQNGVIRIDPTPFNYDTGLESEQNELVREQFNTQSGLVFLMNQKKFDLEIKSYYQTFENGFFENRTQNELFNFNASLNFQMFKHFEIDQSIETFGFNQNELVFWNMKVSYEKVGSPFSFDVGVDNILNHTEILQKTLTQSFTQEFQTTLLPRLFYLKLQYRL